MELCCQKTKWNFKPNLIKRYAKLSPSPSPSSAGLSGYIFMAYTSQAFKAYLSNVSSNHLHIVHIKQILVISYVYISHIPDLGCLKKWTFCFSKSFFSFLKIEIHIQILNTKPFLCDFFGLRYLQNKMVFLIRWFWSKLKLFNLELQLFWKRWR